jgi:hypothetical protein
LDAHVSDANQLLVHTNSWNVDFLTHFEFTRFPDACIGTACFCDSLPLKFGQLDITFNTVFSIILGDLTLAAIDSEEISEDWPAVMIFYQTLLAVTRLVYLRTLISVVFVTMSKKMNDNESLEENARATQRKKQIASLIQVRR